MLGAVRVRAAGAGGGRDVMAAGPSAGVRAAACPRTGEAVPAATCGTPGYEGDAPLAPCSRSRNIPAQK